MKDEKVLEEIKSCFGSDGQWEDLTLKSKLPVPMTQDVAQWFVGCKILYLSKEFEVQKAQIEEFEKCKTIKDLIVFIRKYPSRSFSSDLKKE